MAPKKSNSYLSSRDQKSLLELRHYELEAYAAVVTALRAEGNLNESKQSILKQLQDILCISSERHKAEIRRAANDDNLASIAKQIQGFPCDDDWQTEGRRVFGILNHPLPITAYTKLADEVAESLCKDHKTYSKDSSVNESDLKEICVIPAAHPQQSLNKEILDDIQPPSKDDKDSSNVGSCSEDLNEPQGPYDSLVVLPNGMVVQVESKGNSDKISHSIVSNRRVDAKPTTASRLPLTKTSDSACSVKEVATISNLTTRAQTELARPHQGGNKAMVSSVNEQSSLMRSRRLHSFDDLPTDVPGESEHSDGGLLGLSASFHSSESSSRALSQSFNSSALTSKHHVGNEARNKRKFQRTSTSSSAKQPSKPVQPTSRRPSSPLDKRQRFSTFNHPVPSQRTSLRSPITDPKIDVGPVSREAPNPSPSTLSHRLKNPISKSRPRPSPKQTDASPTKVFRPSLQITGLAKDYKDSLSSPALYSSSSAPSQHCPVETGLAPVSTIVSQVGTHAGLAITTNLPPSRMDRPAVNRPGDQPPLDVAISSATIEPPASVLANTSGFGAFHGLVDDSHIGTATPSGFASQSFDATVRAGMTQNVKLDTYGKKVTASSLKSSLHSPPSSKPVMGSPATPSIARPFATLQPTHDYTHASPSASAITVPRLVSTSLPVATSAPKPQLSTTSIIKVTPKSLAASRGSQIVTQIAGTRITKSLGGASVKPSIIVVRQAGKKSAASAKVMEMDSTGKPIHRVKTVTCSTVPLVKSATIIRSVSGSGSTYESTATSSLKESTVTLPGLQKIVTKGKMRQLVLKSTSPGTLHHNTNPDIGAPIFPVQSSFASGLEMDAATATERSPLHASSAIKALAAMQKATSASALTSSVFAPNVVSKPKPLLNIIPSSSVPKNPTSK